MPKKWVVNASPLIVLARINHLVLLQRLAEEIVVPAGVAKEIAQGSGDDPAREWLQAEGQTLVREMEVVPPVIIAWNLGLGESEVLAWAYQNAGYEAVLDDRAARNCALSLDIPVRGTIGVLLLAKTLGHLQVITPILQQLEKSGFRIDPTVISAAKKLADEE
jgi:predicted nucleic acid-binding protein